MHIDSGKYRYTLIKELGLLVNREIAGEYDFLKPVVLRDKEEQQIIASLHRDISDKEIEETAANMSSLVFGLTENFCRY